MMPMPPGMQEQIAHMQKLADAYNEVAARLQAEHHDEVAKFAAILCICKNFDVYHCPVHSDVCILERISPWDKFVSSFPILRLGGSGASSA